MPEKASYLVRNARGYMRTIVGFSHKGVVREYIELYPTEPGETIEVKRRGAGSDDWQAFRLS